VGLHTHPSFEDKILETLMVPIVPALLWLIWFQWRVERALRSGKVVKCRGYARTYDKNSELLINQHSFGMMVRSHREAFVVGRFYSVYYVPGLNRIVSAQEYVKSKQDRRQLRQNETSRL
jgi:hypothetical protein